MNKHIRKECWQTFFCKFNKMNYLRTASLYILRGRRFHRQIESLQFNKIGMKVQSKAPFPTVCLAFGRKGDEEWQLFHKIEDIYEISLNVDNVGNDKSLNFINMDNKEVQLIFED